MGKVKSEYGPGLKFDTNKLRWDLLPVEQVEKVVEILTYGAAKYADNNWQNVDNGIERYYAALLRHLASWRKGEKIDPESGLEHLSHVACNIIFLMWLDSYGKEKSVRVRSTKRVDRKLGKGL